MSRIACLVWSSLQRQLVSAFWTLSHLYEVLAPARAEKSVLARVPLISSLNEL